MQSNILRALAAEAFLDDQSTNGLTDPIPGLDIAFSQRPQVVYLLTDGDFPDNDRVLHELHKLDPDRKVKIDPIALETGTEDDATFVNLLGKIAREFGGSLMVVHADEPGVP